MAIEIKKAERLNSLLRVGIAGPAGAGKTMSSLKLAKGLGGRTVLIDTERSSGNLYADLFEYSIIDLEPPYKPDRLVEAIKAAEDAGFDNIIIDSLTHFWSDEGGILDQADKLESSGKNRFTMWADLTPQHRRLVNAMLNSTKNIIATVRSKQAYELEKDEKGKTSVKKLGLAPVQREGMEYEFTVFFDVQQNHAATATKDRTNSFTNEVLIIDESVGARIKAWLATGKVDPKVLKREVIGQLSRLKVEPLGTVAEKGEWLKVNIPKLSGVEWSEANLEAIVRNLKAIPGEEEAKKALAVEAAPKAPTASAEAPAAPASAPAPAVASASSEAAKPTPEASTEAAAAPAAATAAQDNGGKA